MAGDVVLDSSPSNPCCAELKRKYAKLEERRRALREGVEILKKACEDERLRVQHEKEEREKDASFRCGLEKEICDLRAEISSYQKREASSSMDELQDCVSRGEMEIKKLKELLENEGKRAASEKKRADSESKRAAEAWKLLKAEKSKVELERKTAETERNKAEEAMKIMKDERAKAEECRICLEKLREATEVREKLVADIRRELQEEKQKMNKEKKHTNSERRKGEEQRRLVEVERKKVEDQNACISDLSKQLEEEKKRRAELEKKLDETGSARRGCSDRPSCADRKHKHDSGLKGGDVKLLRKQLKLKKEQVKHAKRVAQLEKAEKSFIKLQLHLLKQDFAQFSCRLNLLDGHLSNCGEPTRAEEENNFLDPKPTPDLGNDFGLVNTCIKDLHNYSGLRKGDTGVQLSRGSSSRPISGTNSEWDSPTGVSLRKKPQSSAVYSTTTSFSDKKFMGSQGRDAFSVSASAKAEQNYSKLSKDIPEVSGEVAATRDTENGIVADKSDRRYAQRVLSSIDDGKQVSRKNSDRTRKRRRMLGSSESVAWLNSESNGLRHKIGEEHATLNGLIWSRDHPCEGFGVQSHGMTKHLAAGRGPLTEKNVNILRTKSNLTGDTKKQKLDAEPYNQLDQGQIALLDTKNRDAAYFLTEPSNPTCQIREKLQEENRVQPGDGVSNDHAALICFENMICGDYMKLLDLDNDLDEQRYREAIKMPLSPNLPEIHLNSLQSCGDDSHQLVEELFRSETKGNDVVPLHAPDVVMLEIDSNVSKRQTCIMSEVLVDRDKCLVLSSEEAGINNTSSLEFKQQDLSHIGSMKMSDAVPLDNDRSTLSDDLENDLLKINAVVNGQDKTLGVIEAVNREVSQNQYESISKDFDNKASHRIVDEDSEVPLPSGKGHPKGGICGPVHASDAMCLVVFSNAEGEGSISKIFLARNDIINKNLLIPEIDRLVRQILQHLASDANLLPQEKVSVFFSLLLEVVPCSASVNSSSIVYLSLCTSYEVFAAEMIRAISDDEGKWLVQENCPINILASLIQDFLVVRKVLRYDSAHQQVNHGSSTKFHCLDGRCLSFGDATFNQLVAGSIILASICSAFDQIAFLLETSYKIIRTCRSDISWTLSVLHIFAHVCGKKIFTLDNYGFLISAISLVVSFLEQRISFTSPHLHCESGACPNFSPCGQCPFASNGCCEDRFILSLLDELHEHALGGSRCPNIDKLDKSSANVSLVNAGKCEESIGGRCEFGGWNFNCDTRCFLSERTKHSTESSGFVIKSSLCNFADIISLLELITYYKSWEWTCDKVLPCLSSMTQACVGEEFSTALYILIGQLGRLGVEACGYQNGGVVELRCHLSMILDASIGVKGRLTTQFAVVGSLLNLLSVHFVEIVAFDSVTTEDTNQSDQIKLVKKWFSHLSQKNQSLALSLFRDKDQEKVG